MNYTIDHCDPFLGPEDNIWMKLEHCGRYLFARDQIRLRGLNSVLDAACAEGYGLELLEEFGLRTYGADISEEYLNTARTRSKSFLKVQDFDSPDWPAEFRELDAVICFETIEHVHKPECLLGHLHDTLIEGGLLLLSVPNERFEKIDENGNNYDPYHLHIFSNEDIERMLYEAGFRIEAMYGQSLCNDLYAAEKAAIKRGIFTKEKFPQDSCLEITHNLAKQKKMIPTADSLFSYDRESIVLLSHLLAYPDTSRTEDSYSHTYIAHK